MKKFAFSLGTVLDYKNQVLDSLKNEHGTIISMVNRQEEKIQMLRQEYSDFNQRFNESKQQGMTVVQALSYEGYFRQMEEKINKEMVRLAELKKQEEMKRYEVVEAKKETSSIEKLKEKKLMQYNKEVQKSEELFVEEFVSHNRIAHRASM